MYIMSSTSFIIGAQSIGYHFITKLKRLQWLLFTGQKQKISF